VDGDGHQLRGIHGYMLHFPKSQVPPANAFWSLTLYNSHYYFVDNPIGRHAIVHKANSDNRFQQVVNSDGSLDIYLQHFAPAAGRQQNWLPTPWDDFNVMLRLYWPRNEALDGTWEPPSIWRTD